MPTPRSVCSAPAAMAVENVNTKNLTDEVSAAMAIRILVPWMVVASRSFDGAEIAKGHAI